MKKIKIVLVLIFCFISFNITLAESTIIYLKPLDNRAENIKKAQEKLDKDNEENYKQLQDKLKSLSSIIDSNIKTGFTCVRPVASCDESAYQTIRGIAISSGLTPDANQLAQCRAQIDQYNQKLQEYNQCQQNWQNEKINSSAQGEYEYQLQVYELKSELWCMDKEGYYSSFNKKTKECECVEGSTFINGKCENESRTRLNNLLLCVKTFGSLSYYNYESGGCMCEEGSEFNSNNNGLCTKKEKPNGVISVEEWINNGKPQNSTTTKENRYVPIAKDKNIAKTDLISSQEKKPVLGQNKAKETPVINEAGREISAIQSQDNQINPKTTLWQKLKNNILRIKFW